MAATLPVGAPAAPWFGPKVFDDAERCPAKAATNLRAWGLPAGVVAEPLPKMTGGWIAGANLLRALAQRGRTSTFLTGDHPVTDLRALANEVLLTSRGVKDFAVTAVESILDAQASTETMPFNHEPAFLKMPFGQGNIHGGGVLAFSGPESAWQLWRLRMGVARTTNEASRGWALTAAHVLAGHLDAEGRAPLGTVEVFECGAAHGTSVRLGSWDLASLEADYSDLSQGRLRAMAFELETRPGSHCANCMFVGACPSAPRIDGLLALVRRQPTVVKVTATSLRTHADCARRYQLLHLDGLPGEELTGEALQRGQQIDNWLRHNHARGTPCDDSDVDRLRGESGDEVATSMATHHLGVCPSADPTVSQLAVQVDAVALDSASRVLLVARPDALFIRDGRVVWRETKTRTTVRTLDGRQLVETDITAALYLVLLASGATGPPDCLEWEELGGDKHELTVLPVDDIGLVEAARARLSAAVADLLADSTFAPHVGVGCAECAVRRWCPDAP